MKNLNQICCNTSEFKGEHEHHIVMTRKGGEWTEIFRSTDVTECWTIVLAYKSVGYMLTKY